jgi:hypothetical protein
MNKAISSQKINDTLEITEMRDGFWLYDETCYGGMNLSMRAKTKEAALIEALLHYQKRHLELEKKYIELSTKVNSFVSQFVEEEAEITT